MKGDTTVTFVMPMTLKKKAQREAKNQEISMSLWFRQAIKKAIKNGK